MERLHLRIGDGYRCVTAPPATVGGRRSDVPLPEFEDGEIVAKLRFLSGRWILELIADEDLKVNGEAAGRFAYLREGVSMQLPGSQTEISVISEPVDETAPTAVATAKSESEEELEPSESQGDSEPDWTQGGSSIVSPPSTIVGADSAPEPSRKQKRSNAAWILAVAGIVGCLSAGLIASQFLGGPTDTISNEITRGEGESLPPAGQQNPVDQEPSNEPPGNFRDLESPKPPMEQPIADIPVEEPLELPLRGNLQVEIVRDDGEYMSTIGTGWLIRPDVIAASAEMLSNISSSSGHVTRSDLLVRWSDDDKTRSTRLNSVKLAEAFNIKLPVEQRGVVNYGIGLLEFPLGQWQSRINSEPFPKDRTPMVIRGFQPSDLPSSHADFASRPFESVAAQWKFVGEETKFGPAYLQLELGGKNDLPYLLAGVPVTRDDEVVGMVVASEQHNVASSALVVPVAYIERLLPNPPDEAH